MAGKGKTGVDPKPAWVRAMTNLVKHHTEMYNGTPCWEWIRAKLPSGHARMDQNKMAYRVLYERFVGPIPPGMDMDHLCRNPWCVNPIHVEPVTHKENCLRGISPPAMNAKKTHCPRGHELTGSNLLKRRKVGRDCRKCNNARILANYYRKQGREVPE